MDGLGLTLRSKSRRRPQISAPKPISGPTSVNATNIKPPTNGLPTNPKKAQQSGATSDLVKRRYSTRFNAPPDLDLSAPPPLPTLASLPDLEKLGGAGSSAGGQNSNSTSSQPIRIDLNALKDPSLPAEKCKAKCLFSRPITIKAHILIRFN
jgi:exocyst complex component 8